MKIYLGADHGGFKLKEEIKNWLNESKVEFEDMGALEFVSDDDYPDYAIPVAQKVASENSCLGILICRSGQGECIAANKIKGSRAALAWNKKSAFSARNDDDANILCLPADFVSSEEAKEIAQTFIETPFAGEERFVRRIRKVSGLENK